ncbi:MAG: hypothetical protein ACREUZ_21470, partial [Burkholderiales bacterium]
MHYSSLPGERIVESREGRIAESGLSTTCRTVNKAANASSYNAFTMRADALAYQEAGGRPWGLAATLGLSLAIWYALELLQAAMGFGMDRVLAALRLVSPAENTQALNFAVITCISTVLCGALVIAAAALRDRLDPRAYLGIVRAPAREWLRWLGAMA